MNIFSLFKWLIFIFCFSPIAYAEDLPKILQRIEIKQQNNQTILLFTLKNHTNPNLFLLPKPDRLVVDLSGTQASAALPKEIRSNGLIDHIRLGNGPEGPGNLRLVVDLTEPVEYTYLNDQDDTQTAQTLTILLTQKKPTAAKEEATESVAAEPASIEEMEHTSSPDTANKKTTTTVETEQDDQTMITPAKKTVTAINRSSLKNIIIMIDPGHGGKDSGAIGPNNIMEKNIVLAISKQLQQLLNSMAGIEAHLTRQGDYFISLRNRLNIARHNHAQMFIAVHADACPSDHAHGASVFALSEHGASSESARWLAERENTSELSGIDLKSKNNELKSILLDMSQTATVQDSVTLGSNILAALKPFTVLHVPHVEQAGFVVLKSPDIPSVLVETGFISTPEEEHLLSDPAYQNKLAQAIALGINHYFRKNPPPDSWFEMQYKK